MDNEVEYEDGKWWV